MQSFGLGTLAIVYYRFFLCFFFSWSKKRIKMSVFKMSTSINSLGGMTKLLVININRIHNNFQNRLCETTSKPILSIRWT